MSRVFKFTFVYVFAIAIVVAGIWGWSEVIFGVWNRLLAPLMHLPHANMQYFRMGVLYVLSIRLIVDSAKERGLIQ